MVAVVILQFLEVHKCEAHFDYFSGCSLVLFPSLGECLLHTLIVDPLKRRFHGLYLLLHILQMIYFVKIDTAHLYPQRTVRQ